MAKYIKQEMTDLSGKGEEKVYYRLQSERNIDFNALAEYVGRHNGMMSKGLVINVMEHVVDAMAELIGKGHSVTIDGLGTFKASIGLEKDKEMDTIDGDEPKRNARSLRVDGVNFRVDKKLVSNINRRCQLERAGVSRLHVSPYTKEERLQKAQKYIEEHKAMRVKHYMALTGLSHTVAAKELREFSNDKDSGITSMGRGVTVVYILS